MLCQRRKAVDGGCEAAAPPRAPRGAIGRAQLEVRNAPSGGAKPMVELLLLRLKQYQGLAGRITAEFLDEGDCVGE